jgi:hypothetical protein
MSELHPETQEVVGYFISEVIQLLGSRLTHAIARVTNPRAGGNQMADVEVLIVADDLGTKEMYRIWNIAGDATVTHDTVFSVHPYSTREFEERKTLPVLASFVAEGLEYDLRP